MNRRTIFLFFGIVALLLVLGYGLFEGRRIIAGPEIRIDSPQDGSATSTTKVVVAGSALNISFLSINGRQAYTDSSGHFAETLSPPPGYTVITVAAKDRFGRSVSQSVRFTVLNYCQFIP